MKMIAALIFLMSFQVVLAEPIFPIPINPDEQITPGDFCATEDSDFLEYRYPEKLAYCKRNVSKGDKNAIYNAYGVDLKCKHRYTIDHFVPLSIGGNNNHKNLWPEHVLVKETRAHLENELFQKVRDGEMKSEDAVKILIREKTQLVLDLSHVDGCG